MPILSKLNATRVVIIFNLTLYRVFHITKDSKFQKFSALTIINIYTLLYKLKSTSSTNSPWPTPQKQEKRNLIYLVQSCILFQTRSTNNLIKILYIKKPPEGGFIKS